MSWLSVFVHDWANDLWLASVVANWTPQKAYRRAWRLAQVAGLAVAFQAAVAEHAWNRTARPWLKENWIFVVLGLLLLVDLSGLILAMYQAQCTVVVTNTSGLHGHFGAHACRGG